MSDKQHIYDLIILGGGCAGLTAGIYAGRAKMSTLIIEKQQVGGQAATTDEIGNYPGFENITGPELMDRMLAQAKSFGAEFMLSDVSSVKLSGEVKEIVTSSGVYQCRSVIIATGANPKKLGFEGEDEFRGRGVGYCATCDGFFFEGKEIFVIGGGFSAAEEALYLTKFGKKVTILVRKDKFRCAQSVVDKVMAHPKIQVKFNTEMVKVYGDKMLKGAVLKNNLTGETTEFKPTEEDQTFGVFVFIGYRPSTELFKDQVKLNDEGYIITNDSMETNVTGVYAAGDLRPKDLRQLVTATSDGAIAATQAEKYVVHLKDKLGIKDEKPASGAEKSAKADNTSPASEGILTPELREQVQAVFQKIYRSVTLVTIKDSKNEKSLELEAFLREISSLSDKVKLEVYQQGDNLQVEQKIHFERTPVAALLDDKDAYSGVKFCGIPGGHEFNSFIFAIYNLCGPGQPLDDSVKKRIESIDASTHIQVGISLSCHFCPEVVIASQRIAMINPLVEAEMIDVGLFPDFKKQYNIMSVPVLVINKKKIVFGSQSLENILDLIEKDE